MKQPYFVLSAAIAAALASAPALLLAHPVASVDALALSGIQTREAARVTQAVNNRDVALLGQTHLGFVPRHASAVEALPSTHVMHHLQLVLKPSAARSASMEAFIASQHDPKSAAFHKWLSPSQFGNAFGVLDSDIASVTAWLEAQGFHVGTVYPNKTQIDFTGTVAQVNAAFHTQEAIYTLGKEKHISNATDISVPAALKDVVAGVMGLNDFRPTALDGQSRTAQWNPASKTLELKPAKTAGGTSQAISFNKGAVRGLAPNDLATMYNIMPLRANGVTGAGVTIAVLESRSMVDSNWDNFVDVFNLRKYNGSFSQVNPQPTTGDDNCTSSAWYFGYDDYASVSRDAEWATAIAPGAHVVVASCYELLPGGVYATDNYFGGVFVAATNVVNGESLPDVISASFFQAESVVDSASKKAFDLLWAQADAEGISVFVPTGDSGTNPRFSGSIISSYYGGTAIDANALATSPHVTAVGGTDLSDKLDGTTSKYFAPTPSVVGGSALSYVPEIAWNQSCGNGVAAKSRHFSSAVDFCLQYVAYDPEINSRSSTAGGGGPSSVNAKPVWQRQVFNAAKDQSRDLPDVALVAGSFGADTFMITCNHYYPCTPDFSPTVDTVALAGGTGIASPMFAGIQALIDQGIAARGLPAAQGNAAPVLYALAANEYGGASGAAPSSLAACNADNGTSGTDNCVFHNVTRGSISTNCVQALAVYHTPNCYYYASYDGGYFQIGLTTTDAAPTSYGTGNKAYGAQPGWSFATGLGSVNAKNLLIAWRAFLNAPPAP